MRPKQAQSTPDFLTLKELIARLRIGRSTLNDMLADGSFPKPIVFGKRTHRWRLETVDKWIKERESDPTAHDST